MILYFILFSKRVEERIAIQTDTQSLHVRGESESGRCLCIHTTRGLSTSVCSEARRDHLTVYSQDQSWPSTPGSTNGNVSRGQGLSPYRVNQRDLTNKKWPLLSFPKGGESEVNDHWISSQAARLLRKKVKIHFTSSQAARILHFKRPEYYATFKMAFRYKVDLR